MENIYVSKKEIFNIIIDCNNVELSKTTSNFLKDELSYENQLILRSVSFHTNSTYVKRNLN